VRLRLRKATPIPRKTQMRVRFLLAEDEERRAEKKETEKERRRAPT